jgi:hypothetical protein
VRNTSSLAQPAVWLCLLGSALALVSFFLPFFGPSAGSLWGALLDSLRPEYVSFEVLLIIWLGLLLLLLSVGMLASWVICFWPLKWDMLGVYLASTGMALFWYVITALVANYFAWVLTASYGEPFTDFFSQLKIGVLLMPVGLILALRGGNLLDRKKPKQAAQS